MKSFREAATAAAEEDESREKEDGWRGRGSSALHILTRLLTFEATRLTNSLPIDAFEWYKSNLACVQPAARGAQAECG